MAEARTVDEQRVDPTDQVLLRTIEPALSYVSSALWTSSIELAGGSNNLSRTMD